MAVKGLSEIKEIGSLIKETNEDTTTYYQNILNRDNSLEYFNVDDQVDDLGELSQQEIIKDINKIVNGYDENDLLNNQLTGIENPIDVSDLPEGYRFQGYTYTKKFIYITAHDHVSNGRSVILVYDHNGNYLGKMFLPNGAGGDAHVGGVSYDSEHNILYITGTRGDVLVLNNKSIEDAINDKKGNNRFSFYLENDKSFRFKDLVINNKDINLFYSMPKEIQKYIRTTGDNLNAASVYYDEKTHKLYIPTFSSNTKIFVFDVKFDNNGNPIYEYDKIYGINDFTEQSIDDADLPPGVQGVSIYTNEQGEQYLLTVSSYSSNRSVLVKYKINSDGSLTFAGQTIPKDSNGKGIRGAENMMIDDGLVYINVENDVGETNQTGGEFYCYDIEKDINGPTDDGDYITASHYLSKSAYKNGDAKSDYYA